MDVKETLNEGLKREFTVTLPGSEYNKTFQTRLNELAKNLNIDGFRKGKVPPFIAKQHYGKQLQVEIVQKLIEDAVRKVLDEHDVHAVLTPQIKPISVDKPEEKLAFSISVVVAPEIKLPDLSKIKLEKLVAPVSDEEVDNVIDRIEESLTEFKPSEEKRAAKKGDVISIDFVGKENGVPFKGGEGNDFNLELGSNKFIPGFEEQLVGMKPGEKKVIEVTFPKDYHAESLAGKAVTFDVTEKALMEKVPHKFDDEQAKKWGYGDLASAKASIKGIVEGQHKKVSDERLEKSLFDKLASEEDFELPEELVDEEFKNIWQAVEQEKKAGRLDPEDSKKGDDALRKEYKEIARRRIKLGLILAAIGRENGVKVEASDIEPAIKAEASCYPGHEQQVVEYFTKSPQARNALIGDIYQQKAVDYILSKAQITDKEVTEKELLNIE